MGKLIPKQKKAVTVPKKPQPQLKVKKNNKKNKANEQKVALIKKNAIVTANTSPKKLKTPESNLPQLVTPLAPGKVKPKKAPGQKKKQLKKPNPPKTENATEEDSQKPVSPAKPKEAPGQKKKKLKKSNPPKTENAAEEDSQKPVSPAKPKKKPQTKKTDESTKKKVYDPEDKNRTVFVGNLAPNTKPRQLIKFFSSFGEVKSVRLRTADGKKVTKSKVRREAPALNAYVVLKSEESIPKALRKSGCEYRGRHIRITKATNLEDDIDAKRVVFVGNLKFTATDEKLYDIFSTCGEIEYVRTLQSEKGCKGVAYVGFKKPESVTLALELNNTMLDERPIRVERYSKYKQESQKEKKAENGEKVQKPTGAAKRIADKSKKQGQGANNMKNGKNIKQAPTKGKKKSAFLGVKVDIKKKPKKKKNSSAMLQLAKKIAPKS